MPDQPSSPHPAASRSTPIAAAATAVRCPGASRPGNADRARRGPTAAGAQTRSRTGRRPSTLALLAAGLLAAATGKPATAGAPLLLDEGRFRVAVEWTTAAGSSGTGTAVALTADSGYFWFFNPNNVELVVKVLDACSLTGVNRFWFFAAGLTNVATTITVEDLWTGEQKVYETALGQPFPPINDIAAFATCTAPPPPPVASFTLDATCPEPGVCDAALAQPITFTDTSTGAVASRLWELGDGTTATSAQVVHGYAAAGSYPVELTVGNAGGTSAASATVVVATGPPLVSALLSESFSATTIPAGWTTAKPERWSIVDGALRSISVPTSATRGPISWADGLGWTDYAVTVTLAAPGGLSGCCSAFNLYGRFSSVDDHVLLQMHANGRASLVRVVGGSGWILRSTMIGTEEIGQPATYRLEFRDVEITAYRNGVRLFVARDSASPDFGTVGFESFATELTVDDVLVEEL